MWLSQEYGTRTPADGMDIEEVEESNTEDNDVDDNNSMGDDYAGAH